MAQKMAGFPNGMENMLPNVENSQNIDEKSAHKKSEITFLLKSRDGNKLIKNFDFH